MTTATTTSITFTKTPATATAPITFALTFDDDGPDSLGRRHYTLDWIDPSGRWVPEAHPADGKPVGHRRGQCFFGVPPQHLTTSETP